MPRLPLVSSLALFLPPLVVGTSYYKFLGHRSDYLGHFLAGFGGTLAAVALVLALLSMMLMDEKGPLTQPSSNLSPQSRARDIASSVDRLAGWVTLAAVLACIGLGAILEETLYHIAKWDEVDFCNQSLGAVLAGLAARRSFGMPPHPAYSHALPAERCEGIVGETNRSVQANLTWILLTGVWGAIVLAGGYYFAFR